MVDFHFRQRLGDRNWIYFPARTTQKTYKDKTYETRGFKALDIWRQRATEPVRGEQTRWVPQLLPRVSRPPRREGTQVGPSGHPELRTLRIQGDQGR